MKYKIKNIKKELLNNIIALSEVELSFIRNDRMFDLDALITNNDILYVKNQHFLCYEQFNSKDGNGRDDEFYDALKLTITDLSDLEEVIEHWHNIKSKFIGRIPCGVPMVGWLGNNYIYPDGHKQYYKKDQIPKEFEPMLGNSIDDRFKSNGCEYIKNVPFKQHYEHGRFDFNLKRDYFIVNDHKIVQQFEFDQPDVILELLKYIKNNPLAIKKLI